MNSDIYTIQSPRSGPKVVILGSVHGNETIGKKILDQLGLDLTPEKITGELKLIFGNPKAYEHNVRFIDEDMNRLLSETSLSELSGGRIEVSVNENSHFPPRNSHLSYEQMRLREILPHLQNVDFLLDIHSTIQPSVPFVFCEDTTAHKDLAALFQTEYIVSPQSGKNIPEMRACFDNYADRQGGIGLTYEAGQIGNEENFAEVYAKVLAFLEVLGTLLNNEAVSPAHERLRARNHLIIYQALISQTENFTFLCSQRTFLPLLTGTEIARDETTLIRADRDSYLIFPKKNPQPGQIMGYLAYRSK